MRKGEAVYSELARASESATTTCVLAETQRHTDWETGKASGMHH
jgi:hypothetical protein